MSYHSLRNARNRDDKGGGGWKPPWRKIEDVLRYVAAWSFGIFFFLCIVGIPAFGTARRRLRRVAAKMAGQAIVCPMQRQGKAAIRAAADVTTLLAKQGSGEAPAIQKEDYLLTELESACDSDPKRC